MAKLTGVDATRVTPAPAPPMSCSELPLLLLLLLQLLLLAGPWVVPMAVPMAVVPMARWAGPLAANHVWRPPAGDA